MKVKHASRRLLMLVAAMVTVMALAPISSASAHTPVVGVTAGYATLSGGIGACGVSGSFASTAAVSAHGVPPTVNANASVTASFTYCNSSTVLGDAQGTINIDGHSCGFSWIRAGVTAVLLFSGPGCTGGGAAAFAPDPLNPNGAYVVGLGAAA